MQTLTTTLYEQGNKSILVQTTNDPNKTPQYITNFLVKKDGKFRKCTESFISATETFNKL